MRNKKKNTSIDFHNGTTYTLMQVLIAISSLLQNYEDIRMALIYNIVIVGFFGYAYSQEK